MEQHRRALSLAEMEEHRRRRHFLVVAYPAQGHINPGRQLAKRLALTATGARVTFSTTVSAHRHLFPFLSSPDQEVDDGLGNYVPYDDGFKGTIEEAKDLVANVKRAGAKSLAVAFAALLRRFGSEGQPVTCVIFSLLLHRVADVAHDFRVPSVLYWIQAATVFSIYYLYFHGYENLMASHGDDPLFDIHLPGLPPFQTRDLPSFLTISSADHPHTLLLNSFRELFETLDRKVARGKHKHPRPWVLVNSYDALEPEGLAAIKELDVVAIGPVLPPSSGEPGGGDLFKPDEKKYVEWLDSKQPEGSVVYISFGSLSTVKKEQLVEMSRGLAESGRPYLWVVRKDKGAEEEGVELEEDEEKGMVVGWCSQMRVLSHPAVGCFVTHSGWNSTLESLVCGVPMVGVPQWSDQPTNATLVEKTWGTGVRAAVNADGVLEGAELRRCLDVVMGDGERGAEIRSRAAMWRRRASEAVVIEGGSSDRNLKAFVEEGNHHS